MSVSQQHVSVIVPCYNRADTVAEAIQSVLSQDYPFFDVIAVDDGSTDETCAILHAMDDPRLQVISNPGPNGVCGARNAGVALSQGAWVGFQDSDDIWHDGKLTQQMAAVADGAAVAVYCAMEIVEGMDATRQVVGRVPAIDAPDRSGDIRPGLIRTSLISTQTVIIRRDIFDAAGGFDPAFQALVDWDLMLRVAELGDVAFVETVLVDQRMSANSITRSSEKRLAAQEQILAKHHALFARNPQALAHHHYRIAGAHRAFGRWGKAATHLQAAKTATADGMRSQRLKYWGMFTYVRLRDMLGRRQSA